MSHEVETRPVRPIALTNLFGEDISTAKTLTEICRGVGNCLLQAEEGDMRYTTDGTEPTLDPARGFLVPDGQWSPDIITDPSLVQMIGVKVNIMPLRHGTPLQE